MTASGQASAKRVFFFWPFLFSVSGRGKLLPANFLAWVCWSPAGHSDLLPADLMASFMQASAERGLTFFTGNFYSSCLL